MKKILIALIILLLLILGYFMIFRSISIGKFKIDSINNIKNMSNILNGKLQQANQISDQTYPMKVNNLKDATKKLETAKNEYDTRIAYSKSNGETFSTYIREYKIETLMVDLGRYSNQNDLEDLKLDLKTTKASGVYDLNLTIVGPYESVYEFIYDIENDDELLFEIVDLKITPYMMKTTTTISEPNTNASVSYTEHPYYIKETITSSEITDATNNSSNNQNNDDNNNTPSINNINSSNKNNEEEKKDTTTKDITYDPKNVQAEFTIENVAVSLD